VLLRSGKPSALFSTVKGSVGFVPGITASSSQTATNSLDTPPALPVKLADARDDRIRTGVDPRLTRPQRPALTLVDPAARIPVQRLARRQAIAKRLLDIVGASAALLVFAPVLAAIAAVIAAIDGRPVFFRQLRAGVGGNPFTIVKFRTMHDGADGMRASLRAFNEVAGAASFKMTNDPRVSRLGRILRRTSLDELPQLWNVLKGDMSLVGPRPHPFDDVAGYAPWHHARLAVKPGMTGLWQISARGEADFDRWVALDLQYIQTWSLRHDLEILLRTIPAVVRGGGR
jgi:lipopolysaccharide/colanic/teichoic acid biosynthesis glycosyltransferase